MLHPLEPSVPDPRIEGAKAEVLSEIAALNRGILATAADQQRVMGAIARLEALNPTPQPTQATNLLDGNWQLLYTTSLELLGIDRFPLLGLGQIYQCIRVQTQRVYNLAEIRGPWGLDGLVSVGADFVVASDRRINVHFTRAVFGIQRLLNYNAVDEFVERLGSPERLLGVDIQLNRRRSGFSAHPSPEAIAEPTTTVPASDRPASIQPENRPQQPRQGWIELTYLDPDLRINRGNEGSLFVLKRM